MSYLPIGHNQKILKEKMATFRCTYKLLFNRMIIWVHTLASQPHCNTMTNIEKIKTP